MSTEHKLQEGKDWFEFTQYISLQMSQSDKGQQEIV